MNVMKLFNVLSRAANSGKLERATTLITSKNKGAAEVISIICKENLSGISMCTHNLYAINEAAKAFKQARLAQSVFCV